MGRHGRSCSYEPSQVPSLLQERFTLLRYFSQYMDENLTEGGETRSSAAAAQPPPPPPPEVHMRRWVRTHKAIIMQLSNGTLQVGVGSRWEVPWTRLSVENEHAALVSLVV